MYIYIGKTPQLANTITRAYTAHSACRIFGVLFCVLPFDTIATRCSNGNSRRCRTIVYSIIEFHIWHGCATLSCVSVEMHGYTVQKQNLPPITWCDIHIYMLDCFVLLICSTCVTTLQNLAFSPWRPPHEWLVHCRLLVQAQFGGASFHPGDLHT